MPKKTRGSRFSFAARQIELREQRKVVELSFAARQIELREQRKVVE